ncbi:MAG: isoprenoid biosynthesis protein ElbB [Elusimicrobia bacterium GWA2_69_24]|nr:MAG: isoprenoid biosynthesis protein ElbB [Elusimicrobia bacterium GWA2_69_24]HBL19035.1 isoprenoid biosynthesis protein ElbB [Elusimicrobiota bacterium]
MPKIGVILSGCGRFDGSEIHEAVSLLLAIDRAGAEAVCMAPDEEQAEVVDHLSGKPAAERRGVLAESARIARGQVRALSGVRAADIDALILPGGFGAAKNLSTFAKDGVGCRVQTDVARLLKDMRAAGKPIGGMCIAPAVLARVLGSEHPVLTIGSDAGTAQALESMGARHRTCAAAEVVVDSERRIVTTPAYMLAGRISEVFAGAEALVAKVLELVGG